MNPATASAPVTIPVVVLPHAADLPLPTHATAHSAGVDLLAAVEEEIILHPLQRALIPTGLKLALPDGYEAQIRPRSGLALRHGITLVNSPGTIDADYRGEVQVLLMNLGGDPFRVRRGDRIAQMVVAAHARVAFRPQETLETSARGEGGFGSTGLAAA